MAHKARRELPELLAPKVRKDPLVSQEQPVLPVQVYKVRLVLQVRKVRMVLPAQQGRRVLTVRKVNKV